MPRMPKENLNQLVFRVEESDQLKWEKTIATFSVATRRNLRSDCNLLARFCGTKELSAISVDLVAKWVDHLVEKGGTRQSVLRRIRSILKVVRTVGGIPVEMLESLYKEIEYRFEDVVTKPAVSIPCADLQIDESRLSEPEYCRNAVVSLFINEGVKSEELALLKRKDLTVDKTKLFYFLETAPLLKLCVEKWVDHYPDLDDDHPLFFPFTPRGNKPVRKVLHYSSIWKMRCKFNEESRQEQSV